MIRFAWFLAPLLLVSCQEELVEGAPAGAAPALPIASLTTQAELAAALEARRGAPFVLNFWATWCAPCVAELPELMEMAERTGLPVLGVSFDAMLPDVGSEAGLAKARSFLEERRYAFPTFVYDEVDYSPINDYFASRGVTSVSTVPITLAIDAEGRVVDQQLGRADLERFLAMAQKLRER